MARFQARNVSEAVVPAERQKIWEILTDPDRLARLTPLIDRITADGNRWCWKLVGISAMGVSIEPSFTEQMTFTEAERIEFRHTPPPGADERAGARGIYTLSDADDGTGDPATTLFVDITLHAELPLPKMSRRPVERVMAEMMQRTGDRFGHNLYRELSIDESRVRQRNLEPSQFPDPPVS